MLNSEAEAERLEKNAKEEMKNRNYELAQKHFEEAKFIYEQLKFSGKVLFIKKQLVQLKRVIEYEKQKGSIKTPFVERKKLDEEVVDQQKVHMLKKMEEIKTMQMNERDLLEAEKRRAKLRSKIDPREKLEQREPIKDVKIEIHEKLPQKKLLKKEEKAKPSKLESLKIQGAEKQFQKRVNEILAEKKQEEQRELDTLKTLPMELKFMIEKAKMLKQKAEKDVNINIERALGRYQYILELYNSIPKDKVDLTNEISQIENKIAELEAKM